jgi:chromosome segregation ATPase
MADLSNQAQAQYQGLVEKRKEIADSKAELESDLERIKEKLPELKAKRRSIDPDALQAQLAMLTGEALEPEKAKSEKELKGLEQAADLDAALAELKKRMSP